MLHPKRYPPRPPAPPPGPLRRLLDQALPPLGLGLLLIALYALVRANLPAHRLFLMPDAGGMWTHVLSQPAVLAEIGRRALVTISIAATGLAVSIPLGMAAGIMMFRWRLAERALFPWLVALQSIPILAIIPLIQSALGFGFLPKVLIVALFTYFAFPTTLLLGLKSLDRGIIDLFRLQGAGWWMLLVKAGLPSAAPALFAGFRISAGMAVIGAVTSELFFLAGRGGLGQMLINAKTDFKYEQMYAALLASAALSISVYLSFAWVGHRLFAHWHDTTRS